MKLYKSRTSQKVFSVEISETGFVTLRTPDGRIYNNTGSVIGSMAVSYTHLTLPTTPYVNGKIFI